MLAQQAAALPPLRQELALHAGPTGADGAPTWTLHDPIDNRFYQLSWPAFEILSRWSLGAPEALLASVQAETTLDIGEADLAALLQFLTQHHLLAARSAQDSGRLAQAAGATRLSKPMWLLKHYLFFRVPLVRPMAFLQAALPYVRWLYTRPFWFGVLGVALLGLYLVAQQWDRFTHTFAAYSGWQAVLGIGVALSVAKIAHELGHAFTATRHGCRVPHMGVAFLVLFPVLYTDTNEAWKLASRRARLQIGVAGMAAEIALAAAATLLWSFLPDGPLRAGVFLLATSTWLITLAINLSPFMRFDGYFLLADWLDMPNLHERAFALGRWRLRESLFGFKDAPPEDFPPARRRFLLGFAYATWLYRLVLFLGIALLVYHLFFKALGIFLLIVELGWFIAYPVQRELKVWWQRRHAMHWNRATRRSAVLGGAVLLLILLPLPRGTSAPAVMGAEQAQWLYAPAPAQVRSLKVKLGDAVQAGQVLVELESPELRQQLSLAQAREQQLAWQVQQQAFDERLQVRGATVQQAWEAARAQVAGLQALSAQLQLRAAFAGKVVALPIAVQPGAWVRRGEALAQLASPTGVKVQAYVDEQAVAYIKPGDTARFIADEPAAPRLDCRVGDVDRLALPELEHPALASPYGGPLPARIEPAGQTVPLNATFRVRLTGCDGMPGASRELTGHAVIGTRYRSFAGDWIGGALAVLRREGSL